MTLKTKKLIRPSNLPSIGGTVAKISFQGAGAREDSENRPTIYVRRNGSRYIDTEELLQSDKFQETIKELRDVILHPRKGPSE